MVAESVSMDEILDVAVVGGGVSGVYSAWRLMTCDPFRSRPVREMAAARANGKLRITLFEGSDRIGGRLLSVTPPGMPHVRCELGGMRYMSSQQLVRSLVENELKLKTHPMPVAEPENIAYLRGRRLRLRDLTDSDKVPYNVDWCERGKGPDDLIAFGIDQVIPGVTALRGKELWNLLKSFEFQGRHVYDHGFWNLLAQSISREAYQFAKQAGGYDTTALNWNAADTIVLNFDFTPDVTFNGFQDGFEQVPLTLCDRFERAGGTVKLGWWLRSFDTAPLPDGRDGVKLVFHDANDDVERIVHARALILAMPRRSLELLDQTGAVLGPENEEVHALIRSVTPIPLFKAFVCYHHPWWEVVGVRQGRSVTDLPIRQCYYWAVEGRQEGADKKNQNAVLLATYDDTLNVDFWAGLRDTRREPPFAPLPNPYAEAEPGSPDWHDYRAPATMVQEVQRQLAEMHGLRFVPEPYAAVYRDWGEDPYGGGVNFWNIHAKSWEVIPRIARPKPHLPIYVCGEAYSNGQGWVEGALETAELVLRDHFRLPPPAWVERDER